MCNYIVVSGGVISGVGKGVTTASIGKILKEYGYKVTAVKIDPYINYDAGTLRPTEHGEVWVTDDGGEIDQDLGNYERFLDEDIPKKNCLTTGQIYKTVIDKERGGEYLGKTVQFIPHITDEIKKRIKDAADNFDFCLVEIGGTIGDFENIPFLFAVKSLEREIGKKNLIHVLVTYLPTPPHIQEMKTKPTQQAIRMLSENGIFPDFIICRSKKALDNVRKKKIETYVNIGAEHVISEPDIDTIYRIPLDLEKENFGLKILKKFDLKPKKKPDFEEWGRLVDKIVNPAKKIKIAIVGKYINIGDYELTDSYLSINEALKHSGAGLDVGIEIKWIDSKIFEKDKNELKILKNYRGIIIPGGFGSSGVEGKIMAIEFARKNDIPFLGLCYGLQLAVIEFARNVCGMEGANTTEVDERVKYPVIDILPTQKKLMEENRYGATMRLGEYAAILKDDSQVLRLYEETNRLKEDNERLSELKKDDGQSFRLGILENKKIILERHRHRYEVNPEYISKIEEKGLVFSGYHIRKDKQKLMEFIELPNHKFFIGTQGHPEFKSRLTKPAPLFYGFVKACCK
ncbi:CTP synthase (glutamine hydrolyzing) [Candidatus Woesearchaeota archaeon]|nr:CTP synthase (glutamine hydrolyzing) [Candidatus Woesearchaeota archaeon]